MEKILMRWFRFRIFLIGFVFSLANLALLPSCGFTCATTSGSPSIEPSYRSEVLDSYRGGVWLVIASELPPQVVAIDQSSGNEVTLQTTSLQPPYFSIDVPEGITQGTILEFAGRALAVSQDIPTSSERVEMRLVPTTIPWCASYCQDEPIDFGPGQPCYDADAVALSSVEEADLRYLIVTIWEGESIDAVDESHLLVPAALGFDFDLGEDGPHFPTNGMELVVRVIDARFPSEPLWFSSAGL